MTAAALRPDRFTHLFATQRNHPDGRDAAASVLSVVLHGTAAAVVIWASASLAPDTPDQSEAMPIPIMIAASEPAIETSTPSRSGGGAPSRALALPSFQQPVLDPSQPIAAPGTEPWVPPGEMPSRGESSLPGVTPGTGGDVERRDGLVVSSVAPRLLNAAEVQRALQRNYPALLRDAGIGGKVVLWLLIDESGRVIDTDIREGSGQAAFDSAAARVGEIMRFSPGQNRADRVKVWVSLPVVFRTR